MAAGVALGLAVVLVLWERGIDLGPLEAWIAAHPVAGGVVYVLVLAAAVVVMPLSSLPFVPLASRLYGFELTSAMNLAGWWAGALIAFQIARFGRRYLERLVSLAALDRLERRVPPDIGFWGIVVLLMVFPTDVASFALGLLRNLSFRRFALGSFAGIAPFSFVWAYAGGQLQAGDFVGFAIIGVVIVAAIVVVRRLWSRVARPPPPGG